MLSYFFFQAEDGIRDADVTGVQTCALPILQLAVRQDTKLVFTERLAGRASVGVHTQVGLRWPMPASGAGLVLLAFAPSEKIGRASCRERVLRGGVAVALDNDARSVTWSTIG